ncbi:MAG TPA: LacI family DNA-binding transcriptional regulator [Anaerolineae bacterium]|nr:LacI family DNA-binding transcriptional regulator [Anaerolineae bacterium]
MPVTIYDVAKQAEVGVGTVSRVLNNNPRVSPETRQRVLGVIDTLNFRPSPLAQRLSRRKTLSIGVIAVFFTRPSVVERLRGIEAVVAASEYDLIVYNVETPAKRDDIFCATAANRRVDGLLVISLTPADADVERWRSAGVPVVLVDTHHPALPRIVVDDVLGGYRAAQHLLELGHRQIAFVGDPVHTAFNFTSSQDRLAGLCQALAEYDIAWRPDYHQTGEHGQEAARALTHQLLALDEPPTAIFAASDTQALGVMQAAREVGIQVPEDLSVIGFDDIEMAEHVHLTTVRQPLVETGRRGIGLLRRLMDDPGLATTCEELPIELVVRQTTAPPAGPNSQKGA